MNKIKAYLPWIFRILISGIFLLSAVTKMFPLWSFEKQIVDLGLGSWCFANYFSRLIIALELAIGVAILLPHYLRTFVIPVTMALLLAFCLHLSWEIYLHGNSGNCGCFGQLIKMTPLEALIKNIITLGLLVYLFMKVKNAAKGKNSFLVILFIYACSALLMFMVFPFAPCKAENMTDSPVEEASLTTDTLQTQSPVSDAIVPRDTAQTEKVKKDTTARTAIEKSPKKIKSRFSVHTQFGSKKVDLDAGKKILCFFAPGCDHCQATAKELCSLSKKPGFPEVYILFMDEEVEKIPDFFKIASCAFPYKVLDIPSFWKAIGDDANTPGVRYLWNGNERKFYHGTGDKKFEAQGLIKVIEEKFK